jgi:hypothetical protein
MKFEAGKFYTHEKMGDVIFQVHEVGESRVTGIWFTKNGTMLSRLSDNIRAKDTKGWSEVRFKEIED